MTTILVVQIPTATAEEMRRLADRHGLESMDLHELAGFLLQLAVLDQLRIERKRERVG